MKMSKAKIRNAIERTIEEAREYQRQNPDDGLAIIAMDRHRRELESNLDMYDYLHPSLPRAIVSSIMGAVGLVVLPPLIIAGGLVYVTGGLAYLAGRKLYRRIKR